MGVLFLEHPWALSAGAERKSLLDITPLLLSADHGPSAIPVEPGQPVCMWKVYGEWRLVCVWRSIPLVSLWSPLAQSPSLGSTDLSLLCVSLCQTQRNTVVSGRTFALPPPPPWQTRTFLLIYYLGTVIISKVLSHQYHFPHHPVGFTGDDGEWKHQCKCSPKMINLFRGKIV